jgi:AmmeMemoRadiSam system protein B
MQIKEYSLPNGWYPRDPGEISRFLGFTDPHLKRFRAVIAPHAGWYYSGRIAARSLSSLQDAQTVIVLGGHLQADSPPLFAMEDAVRTPFGAMPIDRELRSVLKEKLKGVPDIYPDNTIEVLLPMAHFYFPDAQLLWLRLPECASSYQAGKILREEAAKLGRVVNVIGSTDLTHYGPNYGFSPMGTGKRALDWVTNINDKKIIDAIIHNNADEVLDCARKDRSSCSAGAVLGVMGFAGSGEMLEYGTSADVQPENIPPSFVGYVSMGFNEAANPVL